MVPHVVPVAPQVVPVAMVVVQVGHLVLLVSLDLMDRLSSLALATVLLVYHFQTIYTVALVRQKAMVVMDLGLLLSN